MSETEQSIHQTITVRREDADRLKYLAEKEDRPLLVVFKRIVKAAYDRHTARDAEGGSVDVKA